MEALTKQEQTTPAQLIELAINKDLDLEKLSKLMEMKKQWDADQARKAFFLALNEFQATVPEIRKKKEVRFNSTAYNYAPLADIVRQIKDTCKACGLSYRWEYNDQANFIEVTCLVTHEAGHTERTKMIVNHDESGKKNPIQARGSAIEYGKRYTLIGALGLSTTDSDVDGQIPDKTVDELHADYMELYRKLIELDNSYYSKANPDNWPERTGKVYVAATGHIRKLIADLTAKKHG